ncbi:MAG: hypothetical protein AB7V46_20165, partial [Thermomicrobiales bacterium]
HLPLQPATVMADVTMQTGTAARCDVAGGQGSSVRFSGLRSVSLAIALPGGTRTSSAPYGNGHGGRYPADRHCPTV